MRLRVLLVVLIASCTGPSPKPEPWEICRESCARQGGISAALISAIDEPRPTCFCQRLVLIVPGGT